MRAPMITLREHLDAIRQADLRFDAERDRRLTEVAIEREKALKIKETADLAALQLARDIQIYKDEKANELREQINSERGLYATKGDLLAAVEKVETAIRPLVAYMATNQGRDHGVSLAWTVAGSAVLILIAIAGFVFARGGG